MTGNLLRRDNPLTAHDTDIHTIPRPPYQLARLAHDAGVQTFLYLYGHLWSGDPAVTGGMLDKSHQQLTPRWASHSSELAFVFGNPTDGKDTHPFTAPERGIVDVSVQWKQFNALGVCALLGLLCYVCCPVFIVCVFARTFVISPPCTDFAAFIILWPSPIFCASFVPLQS